MDADLQAAVARSADLADLHANVPTLLLELQTLLGGLTATVNAGTARGRRPYRPGEDWAPRLGELAYGVLLLADQTGVDVPAAVRQTVARARAARPGAGPVAAGLALRGLTGGVGRGKTIMRA